MMPQHTRITSRDNQRLVAARKVRDGKDNTRIFIEGKRLADEAIRSNIEIEECFVTEGFVGTYDAPTYLLSARLFGSIADTKNSQGIALIAHRPMKDISSIEQSLKPASIPVVVFLHEINNPSNLGAVVRTAEAAGAAGVLVSPSSADPFSPKSLRASMGSAFRIPVVEAVELSSAVEWATRAGITSAAADVKAKNSYVEIDWSKRRLLVLGSEAQGLDDDALGSVNETMLIPMNEQVDSLNLAVSVGVLLFEARRQNKISG